MKLPLIVSDELRAELKPRREPVERLSVTVPPILAAWVRNVAEEVGCSQSRVVEVALRRMLETSK